MKLNTVCAIGDVIRARRDLWLEGGSDALAQDQILFEYVKTHKRRSFFQFRACLFPALLVQSEKARPQKHISGGNPT